MRTPVLVVAGHGDTDGVVTALLRAEGTFVVRHRFDGHVVERSVTNLLDRYDEVVACQLGDPAHLRRQLAGHLCIL